MAKVTQVIEITNFPQQQKFISDNDRAVIFFGSSHCGHCGHMAPIYEGMPAKYPTVKFAHVETTRVKTQNINGVPVFVHYLRGEPVGVVLGADPKQLSKTIETNLLPY